MPFDDKSIRALLAKVKRGAFVMPPFQDDIKDLIYRMLTLDPAQRITLNQIKAHPCFRMGLPADYVLPSPLPTPSLYDPIPPESIQGEVFDLLRKVGYVDAEELSNDLQATGHTMAKVFYIMLTSQVPLDKLQWEASVGGVQQSPMNEETYILSPSQTSYQLRPNADPFYRHPFSLPSSVAESINSLASRADWAAPESSQIIYEQMHLIHCPPGVNITMAMYSIQIVMRKLEMQWFHPDDEIIICRHNQQNLYVFIQGLDATEQTPTVLQFQLFIGKNEAFSILIHSAQEVLNALAANMNNCGE